MFLRFSRTIWILAAALTFLVTHPSANAQQLECDILQYKLDRLYFSAGDEALVYPGCEFMVLRSGDTIYSGLIDQSYAGISYSQPTFNFTDTIDLDKCIAVIIPAEIDSLSPITLGCQETDPIILLLTPDSIVRDPSGVKVRLESSDGGRAVTLEQMDGYSLTTGLREREFDGFLSIADFPEHISRNRTVSRCEAPFFAVLIPNLSRESNRDGFLTTSMYYRFDVATVFADLFDDRVPSPMHRLYAVSGHPPRAYPFDPDKGRKLLSKNKGRPNKVSIAIMNRRLKKVGRFFADVLSRDRVRVETVAGNADADMTLAFIPINWQDPLVSLKNVFILLAREKPLSDAALESLAIVQGYLDNALSSHDAATRFHFCRLADRTMQQDLGVFPLFRPTVYVAVGDNMTNIQFDESGYLDIDAIVKLKLPETDR